MSKNNALTSVIVGLIIIGALLIILISGNEPSENQSVNNQKGQSQANMPVPAPTASAEKIEVVHFHATQQCISCITIGKYAGETVNEYFQQELKDGKIEFREVNVDLPENKELARKFQASGSSLFINAVSDGKDNIAEDVKVWRLISDEPQFKSYLKDRINNLLGK